MKKILLAAALLGAIAPSAFAQDLYPFEEFFGVNFNGEALESGATVNIANFKDEDPDFYGEGYVSYEGEIEVSNNGIMPQYIHAVYRPYQQPTAKEYQADRFHWGDVQLCYSITPQGGLPYGNCLAGDLNSVLNMTFADDCLQVPLNTVGKFDWQLHVIACDKDAEATYQLVLQAVDLPDPTNTKNYIAISEPFNLFVSFSEAAKSGVDRIDAAEEEGIYFDLQGRRIENPDKGIYLFRQGGKTIKKIVR